MASASAAKRPSPHWRRATKNPNPLRLTSVWGLGDKHALRLRELGIGDCRTLMHSNPETVAAKLRARRLPISANQVELWRKHAESLCTARTLFFGPPPPVAERFIALDLEYGPLDPPIWLIGLMLVDRQKARHIALWADDQNQERENLKQLQQLLLAYPDLQILTWAGTSADLPQLRNAAARLSVEELPRLLTYRHFDLFAYVRNSLRAPVPELSLPGLASHFGVQRTSTIENGLQAQLEYKAYRALHDPQIKASRKARLIAYNLDDLCSLVGVHRAIVRGATEHAPQGSLLSMLES
jgi:predicted RecB family nuclease